MHYPVLQNQLDNVRRVLPFMSSRFRKGLTEFALFTDPPDGKGGGGGGGNGGGGGGIEGGGEDVSLIAR